MPYTDHLPIGLEPEDEPQAVSCHHCGAADLYWQDTWNAAGQRRPRLYADGKPHVCKPTADDFDEVSP